jgi:uncharacterized phage protein (TIGR01671 family)
MRTFKFRVYIQEHGKFSYFRLNEFDYSDRYLYQHDIPVQQFSGLLDKNGKEIYEGDIVKMEMYIEKVKDFYKDSKNTLLPIILEKIVNGDYCGIVRFDGDNGILSHFQYYIDLIPFYTLKFLTSNIEVVGNIFENSQLLK